MERAVGIFKYESDLVAVASSVAQSLGKSSSERIHQVQHVRLTPSDRAASVTVNFRGSKQSVFSTSPGCGGLCIFIFTSVVALIVHIFDVLPGTSERHGPALPNFLVLLM
jgi:hypothetical protein